MKNKKWLDWLRRLAAGAEKGKALPKLPGKRILAAGLVGALTLGIAGTAGVYGVRTRTMVEKTNDLVLGADYVEWMRAQIGDVTYTTLEEYMEKGGGETLAGFINENDINGMTELIFTEIDRRYEESGEAFSAGQHDQVERIVKSEINNSIETALTELTDQNVEQLTEKTYLYVADYVTEHMEEALRKTEESEETVTALKKKNETYDEKLADNEISIKTLNGQAEQNEKDLANVDGRTKETEKRLGELDNKVNAELEETKSEQQKQGNELDSLKTKQETYERDAADTARRAEESMNRAETAAKQSEENAKNYESLSKQSAESSAKVTALEKQSEENAKNYESLSKQSEESSARVTALESKTDGAITELQSKTDGAITELRNKTDGAITALESKTDSAITELAALEARIGELEKSAISLDQCFPVGSIYLTLSGENPSTLFGGTWEAIGAGRTLVGAGTGADTMGRVMDFPLGSEAGEYAHALAVNEMPSHQHGYSDSIATGKTNGFLRNVDIFCVGGGTALADVVFEDTGAGSQKLTDPCGGNAEGLTDPFNLMQPYLVINMWKRVG